MASGGFALAAGNERDHSCHLFAPEGDHEPWVAGNRPLETPAFQFLRVAGWVAPFAGTLKLVGAPRKGVCRGGNQGGGGLAERWLVPVIKRARAAGGVSEGAACAWT